jgi:Xaa-Pro aminopeptidase
MTLATLSELTAAITASMPDAAVVDGMGLVHRVRMWKSHWEIDRLRWACAANQAGLAAAFSHSQDGRSEVEIAREILVEGLRAGAGWPAWTMPGWIGMTSGAGNYHRFVEQPTTRRIGPGDMLWTDIGFRVDGYWSDYCRAAVVGGPTAQQVDHQRRILAATAAGVGAAIPGATASDVARAVGAELERQGLPGLGFGRVGHGIGLTATEPPSIALHDDTVLEAGMVITVEPAAVLDDGIYCAEQIVVVGEPPEVLSVAPLELSSI